MPAATGRCCPCPGTGGEDGVIRLQRQHDGDPQWLELHWRRLNFRDSVQLILTLRDITLAMRAERARRQEQEQLRHQLEQERAFAQAIAHELRTPWRSPALNCSACPASCRAPRNASPPFTTSWTAWPGCWSG